MLKNKLWIGIILSIILMVFSINGFTLYYKYTQESGTNFYVGTADKADALEDTNEMRQIIDDLGALLVHSKRNDLYPKDATTGGTIQIPEAGLKFSNAPVNDDIAAYIAGEMAWQTKAELGIDLTLYYLKTEMDSFLELQAIIADKTLVNTTDKLNVFAATTSAELAGVISDETGSGSLVFGTAPIIAFPEKTPVNAIASQGTITMAGIAVADETFVIDTQTFTWKVARTVAGEVTIGADAPAAVTNIVTAVTADLATVTAVDGAGDTVTVTAVTKGVAGNSIVFTEASTNMAVDGAGTLGTTTAGVDGTVGVANEIAQDATYLYVCIATNTIADTNWRRIALGSAY